MPNMIDGEMGDENISESFVYKYKYLYNYVSYNNITSIIYYSS